MPGAAEEALEDAWRAAMGYGAAVAAGGRPRLLIEVVADLGRDVVMRWSAGPEQQLPMRLNLAEAVRCLAGYLQSGMLLVDVFHFFAVDVPVAISVLDAQRWPTSVT